MLAMIYDYNYVKSVKTKMRNGKLNDVSNKYFA